MGAHGGGRLGAWRAGHHQQADVCLRGVDGRVPGARRRRGDAGARQRAQLRGHPGAASKARARQLDRPPPCLEPRPLVDHAHAARGAGCVPRLRRLHPREHHQVAGRPGRRGLPVRRRRRGGRAAGRACGHRSLTRGIRVRPAGAGAQLSVGELVRARRAGARALDGRSRRGRFRVRSAWRAAARVAVVRVGAGRQRRQHHSDALAAVVSRGRVQRLARAAAAGPRAARDPGARQRGALRAGADRASATRAPARARAGGRAGF